MREITKPATSSVRRARPSARGQLRGRLRKEGAASGPAGDPEDDEEDERVDDDGADSRRVVVERVLGAVLLDRPA